MGERTVRIVALVALSSTAVAQSFPPAWLASFDGPAHQNDVAAATAVMPTGEVAVAGTTWLEPQPGVFVPHFFTALYWPQGQELWTRIHDTTPVGENGKADRIAITTAGKIVVAGTRDSGSNWLVVQYDAAGGLEWETLWVASSQSHSRVEDLVVSTDGSIYLCGDLSFGAVVAKLSSTGALMWTEAYNGTGLEIGSVNALAVNAAGEVFLTGTTVDSAGQQFSVARIDAADGQPLWIRNFGAATGISYSEGGGVGTDGIGRVIASGIISDFTALGAAVSFVALASDGTLAWRYDHAAPNATWGVVEDVAVGATGNITAAGWLASQTWQNDGFVVRVNAGVFGWERLLASSSQLDDRAVAVEQDSAGNVYAAALVPEPNLAFDVFQYSSSGELIARGKAPVPGSTGGAPRDLALGANGRAYVVGDMGNLALTSGDAVTVAFDLGPPVTAFCFGDDSGTICPCSNASAVGANAGCVSSIGTGGRLTAGGAARVSADTFTLHAAAVPNGPGLYIQGSDVAGGGFGFAFGDGLLCASGSIVRLGIVFASSNASSYPGGSLPAAISVGGSCAPGDTRHYQLWYRDGAPSWCTSEVFNLTNALSVTWGF